MYIDPIIPSFPPFPKNSMNQRSTIPHAIRAPELSTEHLSPEDVHFLKSRGLSPLFAGDRDRLTKLGLDAPRVTSMKFPATQITLILEDLSKRVQSIHEQALRTIQATITPQSQTEFDTAAQIQDGKITFDPQIFCTRILED